MFENNYFNQLKEVHENILKVLNKEENIDEIKTIGSTEILFKSDKGVCVFLIYDYKTLKLIEKKELFCKECIPYSPRWSYVREGTPIIELFNSLENKPDVIMIEGSGRVNENIVETSSYVGVLLNKPVIAVGKDLKYGKDEYEKILFKDKLCGYVLKTKEISKPIYITSGFKIPIEKSLEIVKHCLRENKMPEPLHNVHKIITKLKKEI